MEKFYKKLSLTIIDVRLALLTSVTPHLGNANTKLLGLIHSTP